MRSSTLAALAAIAGFLTGCGSPAITLLDATYHGRPKLLLVKDSFHDELPRREVEAFRATVAQELESCNIPARIAEEIETPPLPAELAKPQSPAAAKAEKKPDAVLFLRVASARKRYGSTVEVTMESVYYDVTSSKPIWKLSFRHTPPFILFSDGSNGRELAKDLLTRLAKEGVLKGCPGSVVPVAAAAPAAGKPPTQ